jgi:hypothetical protein
LFFLGEARISRWVKIGVLQKPAEKVKDAAKHWIIHICRSGELVEAADKGMWIGEGRLEPCKVWVSINKFLCRTMR